MKGYTSKYDRAVAQTERQFSHCSEVEKKRVVKQLFAKLIVGPRTTIGTIMGQKGFKLKREHPHDGINTA
jgi:hypothetical protein